MEELMKYRASLFFLIIGNLYGFEGCQLPEIYQDVLIKGEVIHQGVRSCADRYEAIKSILATLPKGFKVLDLGASQGYFSFRMADEWQARCTMVEDGYAVTNQVWNTADYLKYLCEKNSHLRDVALLKKKFFAKELNLLRQQEEFDLVCAFSVIHHMKHSADESHDVYLGIIDGILALAPVVLIEMPANTGDHTVFIRKALRKRGGKVIYQSNRDTLIYEIYLFDKRTSYPEQSDLKGLSRETFITFNGCYPETM
jgi:hypothetical protein